MAGLESIFLAQREPLLRFLKARGAADPEDILQELWIRASAHSHQPLSDPLAYLFRAANNLMLDHARTLARQRRRESDWVEITSPAGQDLAVTTSQEQVLLAREQLTFAEAVLHDLGPRTEAIFRKFRLEGRTQPQIATELGISLSAVEKSLRRAYRALAELPGTSDGE